MYFSHAAQTSRFSHHFPSSSLCSPQRGHQLSCQNFLPAQKSHSHFMVGLLIWVNNPTATPNAVKVCGQVGNVPPIIATGDHGVYVFWFVFEYSPTTLAAGAERGIFNYFNRHGLSSQPASTQAADQALGCIIHGGKPR